MLTLLLAVLTGVSINDKVHGSVLYPHNYLFGGRLNGDDVVSKEIRPVNMSFKYSGSNLSGAYISTNGVITFGAGMPHFSEQSFPLNDSIPKIAPFWADIDTTVTSGQVYYRIMPFISTSTLTTISSHIQAMFPDSNFQAVGGLIVTWSNVTYKGGSSLTPNNTFQAVVVGDGNSTYAIFNYQKLTWTTDPASGGDQNGLGGVAAQAGFDLGDGVTYLTLNGSQTADVLNLAKTSNSATPGRWIFLLHKDEDPTTTQDYTTAEESTSRPLTTERFTNDTPIAAASTANETELTATEIALISVGGVASVAGVGAAAAQLYSPGKTSVEPTNTQQQNNQDNRNDDQSDDNDSSDDEKKKKKKKKKSDDKKNKSNDKKKKSDKNKKSNDKNKSKNSKNKKSKNK